jgi:hypothetical protein
MLLTSDVTIEIYAWAEMKAHELAAESRHKDIGKNVASFIGDWYAAKYLGAELKHTKSYDLLDRDLGRVDVKTKRRSGRPFPHYGCDVALRQTALEPCDTYLFATILWPEASKLWLEGWMPKPEFLRRAILLREGATNPENGWKCTQDCFDLLNRDLRPLPERRR